MSNLYTIAEANKITQMLKDIAALRADHPGGPTYNFDDATKELTQARDFWVSMLERQETSE